MSETKTILPLNNKIIILAIILLGAAILLTALLLWSILPGMNKSKYEWQDMSFSHPAEWTVEEHIPVSHAVDYQATDMHLLILSTGDELSSFSILSDNLSEKDAQATAYKDYVLSFMDRSTEDVIAGLQASDPTATEINVSEITLNNRSWQKVEYLREYEKSYPNETVILQEIRYRYLFKDRFITIQYNCPVEQKETLRAFEEILQSLQIQENE